MSEAKIYRREVERLRGLAALAQNIIRKQEYLHMADEYERLAIAAQRASGDDQQDTGG